MVGGHWSCDPDLRDPAQIESPLVGENIFSTHGRGIYLINQLMDSVRFERGGTEIHMRKS